MPTDNIISIGAISKVLDDIDDFCGTKPRKWPWPRPKKELRDALLSIVIHRLAGELSDSALRTQVQKLAETNFDDALKQIAN